LDFLQAKKGITLSQAIEELGGKTHEQGQAEVRQAKAPKAVKNAWTVILPTKNTPKPEIKHYRYGKPDAVWAWHNKFGIPIHYTCRFDNPKGQGKEVLPFSYAENGETGELAWRWLGLKTPRPLYDLHLIEDATHVLVVEGEKTAEAAKRLFPKLTVTTWIGGKDGVGSADWSVLTGKKVYVWPDHDLPGYEAAAHIADILADKATWVKYIRNPKDAPPKWDVADVDWTPQEARTYLLGNCFTPPTKEEVNTQASDPQPMRTPTQTLTEAHKDDTSSNAYFRCLGFGKSDNGMVFYLHGIRSNVISCLAPSSLGGSNLMTLAPLGWWEATFPSESKNATVSWAEAADWIIEACTSKGMFNPLNVRGRGAWVDEGRIVIHTGDKLIVDGKSTELHRVKSKYVYDAGLPLNFELGNIMTKEESKKVLDATSLCNWERSANAYLLAGWCVIAPICGALPWRPHIWLTGAAGTGKSWIYSDIVIKLLGDTALHVQSSTTNAAIRQFLGTDGRPVVFDEIEITSPTSAQRVQDILEFTRAASADGSGAIMKGTIQGIAKQYMPRACFALSSIGVGIKEQSDRRRFTILGAKAVPQTPQSKANFLELEKIAAAFNNSFCKRLQARTISLLPTILHNSAIFAEVVSSELGGRAYGDQIGPMLAGAVSLYFDGKVTREYAVKLVQGMDWAEEKALDTTKDEMACLYHVLQTPVQVEGANGRVERTVGDLVDIARGFRMGENVACDTATERLKRMGIKLNQEHTVLVIANQSRELTVAFKGQERWQENYSMILKRIDGATVLDKTRFGTGIFCRAVSVPLSILD
jgi:putative DNA primase/helicase